MTDLKTFLTATPENLAHKQHEALSDAVVTYLKHITNLIKTKRYELVLDHLAESPSGDDHGCDNTYISFYDLTGYEDIGQVIETLRHLHDLSKGNSA